MASQDNPSVNPSVNKSEEYDSGKETKYMWIAVALIVLIMAGGMGINMLVHHETNAEPAGTSTSQTPQQ